MISLSLLASLESLRLSVLPVSQRIAYEKIIYSQNDLRTPPELIQGPAYLRPLTSARLSSLWDVVQHHIEISFVALLLISFMSPLQGELTWPSPPVLYDTSLFKSPCGTFHWLSLCFSIICSLHLSCTQALSLFWCFSSALNSTWPW